MSEQVEFDRALAALSSPRNPPWDRLVVDIDHSSSNRICARMWKDNRAEELLFPLSGHDNLSKLFTVIGQLQSFKDVRLDARSLSALEEFAVAVGKLGEGLCWNQVITELLWLDLWDNDVVIQMIRRVLEVNSCLKILKVSSGVLGSTGCSHLASALCKNTTLEELDVVGTSLGGVEGVDLLLKPLTADATTGHQGNLSLTSLRIGSEKDRKDDPEGRAFAVRLANMLRTNSTLKELSIVAMAIDATAATHIGTALGENTSLETLRFVAVKLGPSALQQVIKPLASDSGAGYPLNTSIKSLQFSPGNYGRLEGGDALSEMLKTNGSLSELSLRDVYDDDFDIVTLLTSLKENTSLRILDLTYCKSVDGDNVLATIMDLLRINPWIERLKLAGTPLARQGKDVMVRAQIEKNLQQRMEVLREMMLVQPKCARVFLCGHPYAGKTTLCRSMMRYQNARDSAYTKRMMIRFMELLSRPRCIQQNILGDKRAQRTRGIEITRLLTNDERERVTIWDLAGQEEYHAFHDLMIPNMSGQGSSCLFLILCNPFMRVLESKKWKKKSFGDIKEQIVYWLRFIASNTIKSVTMQPHVVVVFTNADRERGLVEWARNDVHQLRDQFRDAFIDVSSEVFAVNALSSEAVGDVADYVMKSCQDLLEKQPRVYEASAKLGLLLENWNLDHPDRPVMRWSDFSLHFEKVIELSSDVPEGLRVERFKAVAAYLHDVGEAIYFEDLDLIVVNPNWFCHEVMGKLIQLRDSDKESDVAFTHDDEGVATRDSLELVLKESLQSNIHSSCFGCGNTKKWPGIEPEELVRIMARMGLCHSAANPNEVFIPATLRDDPNQSTASGDRQLEWPVSGNTSRNVIYIGRRLECDDPVRTFLSPGFFPHLQVHLRNLFGPLCKVEKFLISIPFDGMEILVESSGDVGCYIDVLVCSTKDQKQTLELVQKHVVIKIQELCASSSGCQGVVLVEGIVRPQCVQELTLCKYRKHQSVLVEDLKRELLTEEGINLQYEHTWGEVKDEINNSLLLGLGFDRATELLGEKDTRETMNRRLLDLRQCATNLNLEFPSEEPGGFGGADSSDQPAHIANDQQHEYRRIESWMRRMEAKMDDLQRVINSGQEKLLRELHRTTENLFLQDRQKTVPRMVFFTGEDVGMQGRLITRLVPDMKKMRLHLMCEHRGLKHRVDGQLGCEVLLLGETAQKVLPMLVTGLKVLSFVIKVGAQVLAGVGSLNPDVSKALTLAIDEGIKNAPTSGLPQEEGHEQWLMEFLKGKNIKQVFGLERIKYEDDQSMAWVCHKHKRHGLLFPPA